MSGRWPEAALKSILAILLLALAGCTVMVPQYRGEDAGYRFILHQPVTIPADRTRVYIQGGRVSTGFNSYAVSCSLEVRTLAEEPRTVQPDTFVVYRIQQFFEEVAAAHWKPVQLASLRLADAAVDGGPSDIFRGFHFWLHSDQQPDVLRLTCRGVFAAPWEAYPPTYEEIVETLGEVADLKSATETIPPGKF